MRRHWRGDSSWSLQERRARSLRLNIGYGGLDHVLATGHDVNILVMDTEVYSNTGGQASKATPMGAAAKFASAGKATAKKDLGMIAMSYGSIYVAKVAFGSKDTQTVKALQEAESFHGSSLVLAYSHCIAHGFDLQFGLEQQKLAVDSGHWPLYRFDPRLALAGRPPLQMDSMAPRSKLISYVKNEQRYRMVEQSNPEYFKKLMTQAQFDVTKRWMLYEQMSKMPVYQVEENVVPEGSAPQPPVVDKPAESKD